MSKPSIQNITTTQTFQNWLDKTNEMVDIFRDSAITASASGDETTGDATVIGDFTANNMIAYDQFRVDEIVARTPGNTIQYDSPVEITGAISPIVATFNYGASGGRVRFTEGTNTWDQGFDTLAGANFVHMWNGEEKLKLSNAGVLTVDSIVVATGIDIIGDSGGGSINLADATITGNLIANNAVITTLTSNDIRGRFTGDIYHPQGNKIFENGGPGAEIPATFTGNVLGTVSSLTNHTTNNLTEGSTNLYYTDTRVRDAISGGTGVDFSSGGVISIGQNVGTTANVGFKTVTATGDITAFGTISDITMKENINPISNALDKISQLGGYTFNYKGNETPMTGVMAQELQKVLPEAVYQTNDPTTNETVYAVRHGNVIGLLIEAIKELQEKVGK
jgi:hypothetical protein